MSISKLLLCLTGSASLALLSGQPASTPTAYTVTQVNSMFGPTVTMTVYRNGSKALIENSQEPNAANPKGSRTRSLYDLQAHTNFTWSLPETEGGCGTGSFSGDWGDPFASAADLANQGAKQTGTENFNGASANVLEAAYPGGKVKAWVDAKTGLVMKAQMTPDGGAAKTVIETKKFTAGPPAASVFALPAVCAAAANAPHVPTEAERIDTETGGHGSDFVNGIYGPGSAGGCLVTFRIVKAGTMEPVTVPYQVAIDTTYDQDHPPSYSMGVSDSGHMTYSGGGLHEITDQIHNGVLRLAGLPKYFNIAVQFGKAGGAGPGLIYRQCFKPQTVLLLVVKNPDKISEGADWLWVKSGKYAAPDAR